ncbi:MAG TPA: D-alanyl-D-alanine carboxypeptidase [Clostridiales bacterium]|nr:D-alanyl-D-alanine carboxypeptidase [Clostridiales bacterium]
MKKKAYNLIGISLIVLILLFAGSDTFNNRDVKLGNKVENQNEIIEKIKNEEYKIRETFQEVSRNPLLRTNGVYYRYKISAEIQEETIEDIVNERLFFDEVKLIKDSTQISYMDYVPYEVDSVNIASKIITNKPNLDIAAKSALLVNVETGEVLYYKNPCKTIFPASTVKLLTAIVALDHCDVDDIIVVGEEASMIASDSSKANLVRGHTFTLKMLLEALLIPSGNDAAYVIATHVGRRSLGNMEASIDDALLEFIRLMNEKAYNLGAENSCFKTPDGYDAIGQYTNVYDMALIGVEAIRSDLILEISKKPKSRTVCVSGQIYNWNNTNGLINKDSANYYEYAIGLKTGTSTMAGRCLISAAQYNGKRYIAVVMGSTAQDRFKDAQKILKFAIK